MNSRIGCANSTIKMPPRGSSLASVGYNAGNPGDTKSIGAGVMEMRIDYGPGYRVYFTQRGKIIVILLCAGDKRTQKQDIKRALELARELAERR